MNCAPFFHFLKAFEFKKQRFSIITDATTNIVSLRMSALSRLAGMTPASFKSDGGNHVSKTEI